MRSSQTAVSDTSSPTARLIGLVQQLLASGAQSRPISLTMRLADLGVASIQMVHLMLAVEAEFNLTIPQADITPENFHSIDSIAALILKLLP